MSTDARILREEDVLRAAARLPEKLGASLMDLGSRVGVRAFVAGGHVRAAITGERTRDVDVFVRDRETADELIETLGGGAHETEFALSVSVGGRPVQVIHRWTFESPAAVIRHFDFSVCQGAIWYDGSAWRGACSEDFYPDLAARRLRFQQADAIREPVEAGGTLLRLMKYAGRGYSASPETVAAVAFEAVTRTDDFAALVDALRGVDPLLWPAWMGRGDEPSPADTMAHTA